MTEIRWTEDAASSPGSRERGFKIITSSHEIPGVFWYPEGGPNAEPLILMGHGGSGHKRSDHIVQLGQMFAADYGWCAASIDGPRHGGRGSVTDASDPEYKAMWQTDGIVEQTIDDWRSTLDALIQLGEVDSTRVGYWGMSMGTMFGLPYVANDDRIIAAILGKAGMTGPSVKRSGVDIHFSKHAPKVLIPVLFSIHWDDERFDRDGQLDLFDRIGAKDKRLHAYPGLHVGHTPEEIEVQAEFFERHF